MEGNVKKYHHLGIPTEIAGKEILIEPNGSSKGIIVAFIVDNGAPRVPAD